MSVIAVVCPRCSKRQEVNVGLGVPADGLRSACTHCGTTIIVRGRAAGGVPELPMGSMPSGDLPAARESVPRPPTGGDDPNLPVDIGLPDDLMEPRNEELSRDLPTPHARGSTGGGAGAVGVDLMDPQEINLATAAAPAARAPASGQPTDPRAPGAIPLGIDIFIGSMPAAKASPLEPLDLDLLHGAGDAVTPSPFPAAPSAATPPPPGALSLELSPPPPVAAPRAAAPPPSDLLSLELSAPPAAAAPRAAAAKPAPQVAPPPPSPMLSPLKLRGPGGPAPAAAKPAGSPPPPAAATDSGGPLDMAAMLDSLIGDAPPPESAKRKPPAASFTAPAEAPAAAAPAGDGDAMFSLKLDDGAAAPEEEEHTPPPKAQLPKSAVAPTATSSGDALPVGVPALAPPRSRKTTAFVEDAPRPRSSKVGVIVGGIVGALVLVAGGVFVVAKLNKGPVYAKAIAPHEAELARDHYPAYNRAAEAILAYGGAKPKPVVRAAAAELMLLAMLGRGGEKAKITRAEELLAGIATTGDVAPEIRRAHALLAVAKSKGSEAEQLLAAVAGSPEAQLISGLRRLRERKPELAVAPLRGLADATPDRVLPRFLLARALEESRQTAQALKAYDKVLAINKDHAGALVGRARLQPGPPQERRAAAEALAKRITGRSSPGELAEVQVLQGETTLGLGRAAEAVEVLSRAVAASPGNATGQAALAEALIADGRPADALGRLRSTEGGVLATLPARIALAAALIANGQIAEGTTQIEALGPAGADNPRVPYWLGVAAETGKPPDLDAAARRYRTAVDIDARFLPAALRLAALLQKQGKADKALALIQSAEKAGVAPEALELAWGQALIAAKNPQEAEAVYRKAVARAPKLAAARVGLAAALEEGGKLDEAEAELEKAASDLKVPGLRDRLAELLLKRGKKQAALSAFEAELASGNNDPTMRVRLAKLALDMGKLERAARELEMVTNDSPGTPEAYYTLGRVREAAGEPSRALKEYRGALLYESYPLLHLALGRTLAALGKEDDALVHLGAAGDLAAARLERARIRLRRSRLEEALIDAEAAARLEPDNAQIRFVQGLCLDMLGRADEAAAAWRAAIKASPELAEAHYRVGRYEMDKGRPAAAIEALRQASSRKGSNGAPWEAELYFQLALAELNGGSRGAAATALRRYLEVAPPDAPARPEAERMLAKLPGR